MSTSCSWGARRALLFFILPLITTMAISTLAFISPTTSISTTILNYHGRAQGQITALVPTRPKVVTFLHKEIPTTSKPPSSSQQQRTPPKQFQRRTGAQNMGGSGEALLPMSDQGMSSLVKRVASSPSRWLPLVAWISFIAIVFLSDIPPGPSPILAPTWDMMNQVKDYTVNFWLVLPSLLPNLAPAQNPVAEGVFNILLAWSALFSGFLPDGRTKKTVEEGKEDNMFLPFLITMLVMTNAAYLPYLVIRPDQSQAPRLAAEDLTKVERGLGETKGVTLLYTIAGAYSFLWTLLGRPGWFEAGGTLAERWSSLLSLVSTDRLMVAFVTELFLFWAFQGWMVDDDWAKRARKGDDGRVLKAVAKVIPFFGLGYYLWARPPLPSQEELEAEAKAAAAAAAKGKKKKWF